MFGFLTRQRSDRLSRGRAAPSLNFSFFSFCRCPSGFYCLARFKGLSSRLFRICFRDFSLSDARFRLFCFHSLRASFPSSLFRRHRSLPSFRTPDALLSDVPVGDLVWLRAIPAIGWRTKNSSFLNDGNFFCFPGFPDYLCLCSPKLPESGEISRERRPAAAVGIRRRCRFCRCGTG